MEIAHPNRATIRRRTPLASAAVPTLSEAASKQLLAAYGVPVLDE